eukprot:3217018-Alexandrium_andersonii.AAC.1
MSASLVGSEMCIRDRSGNWPPPCGCLRRPLARLYNQPALRRHRPSAVSYTHLTLPTICSV